MPKMKTHSGSKKRFKKLKSGIIKTARPYRRHLLTKKSNDRKRNLRRGMYIATCDMPRVAPLLPY